MMQRVVGFIVVVLVSISCGNETPHATPSFIAFEHENSGEYKYLNLLIEHVHDDTWHIPYASTVQKDFSAAITIALQTWLQPLRNLQLSQAVVDDFEIYRYSVNDFNTGNVPWDDVLFRIIFEAGNNGDNIKGQYLGISVRTDMLPLPPVSLSVDELPILTVYDAGNTADELTTDTEFMFILVHEMGHAFGLADTYATSGNSISGRKGNQPASVMASSREVFNYPPILPHGTSIELLPDDIRGLTWLYKKHVTREIGSFSDCHLDDYKYESSPAGCVPGTPPTEPEPQPPTEPPTKPEPQPPTTEPPTKTCADDPCADACLTGCRYRNCGLSYANPDARYRTSCYSRDNGQWCGSAGQGRADVCQETAIQPPTEPPPATEPDPQPPVVNDSAAQCCDAGFSCAAWPGKADIFLCHAAPQENETVFSSQSPCCQTNAYECEAWPGRAAAVICFGL